MFEIRFTIILFAFIASWMIKLIWYFTEKAKIKDLGIMYIQLKFLHQISDWYNSYNENKPEILQLWIIKDSGVG